MAAINSTMFKIRKKGSNNKPEINTVMLEARIIKIK